MAWSYLPAVAWYPLVADEAQEMRIDGCGAQELLDAFWARCARHSPLRRHRAGRRFFAEIWYGGCQVTVWDCVTVLNPWRRAN